MSISPDGNSLYGSFLLTITTTSGDEDYVAESFDTSFPVDVVTLQNEDGNDKANVYISRSPEGSATLQVDNSQKLPEVGDVFDTTIDSTTHTFLITETSIARSNTDFAKVSISFRKRLN